MIDILYEVSRGKVDDNESIPSQNDVTVHYHFTCSENLIQFNV